MSPTAGSSDAGGAQERGRAGQRRCLGRARSPAAGNSSGGRPAPRASDLVSGLLISQVRVVPQGSQPPAGEPRCRQQRVVVAGQHRHRPAPRPPRTSRRRRRGRRCRCRARRAGRRGSARRRPPGTPAPPRARRAAVGWAAARARNPPSCAGVYGALARSRGSGASAGSRWAPRRGPGTAGWCAASAGPARPGPARAR